MGDPGGAEPQRRRRGFLNILKTNEKFTIFVNFNVNFCYFFKNLFKFYRIFRANLGKNLGIIHLKGFGGGEPTNLANLLKTESKIQWKHAIF